MICRQRAPRWCLWAAAAVAALIGCMYACGVPMGDDLAYMGWFTPHGGAEAPYAWSRLPVAWASHWLHANGRAANLLFIPLVSLLPRLGLGVIMAWSVYTMVRCAARLSGMTASGFGWALALAFTVWGLPWWDNMLLVDVGFNYPLACALVLLFVLALLRPRDAAPAGWQRLGLLALALLAGAMHEAASLPLLLGIGVSSLTGGRWEAWQRRMVLAFTVGTAFVALAPGIWTRFGSGHEAEAPALELLAVSAPLALAVVMVLAVMLCFRPLRRRLAPLWRSRRVIWVAALPVSLAICVAGGIAGRSGWFAEMYAFIALCSLVRWGRSQRLKWIAWGLGGLVLVQTGATVAVKYRCAQSERKAVEQYAQSTSPVVRAPLPRQSRLPWWTLGTVRVLDADDLYDLETLQRWHGRAQAPVLLHQDAFIIERLPGGARRIEGPGDTYPAVYLYESGGRQYAATPAEMGGRRVWVSEPREIDPGDLKQ